MKTITPFLGEQRVTATETYDGHRTSVLRDCIDDISDHKKAAVALCRKMGWHTELVGGFLKPNTYDGLGFRLSIISSD